MCDFQAAITARSRLLIGERVVEHEPHGRIEQTK
jgi:hypothetical protein